MESKNYLDLKAIKKNSRFILDIFLLCFYCKTFEFYLNVSSIHVLYLRVEDLPEAPLMFGRSKCAFSEGKATVMRFNLASSLFTVPHSGLSSQTHCEICINNNKKLLFT